jgi:putative heme-binding domain-containing protein
MLLESKLDSAVLIRGLLATARGLKRAGSSLSLTLQGMAPEQIGAIFAEAGRLAASDEPAGRRLAAIALLGMDSPSRSLATLRDLLDARQPSSVQLAALQALGALDDAAVGSAIVSQWKAMSPAVRREATEVLFSRPGRLEQLIEALKSKTLRPGEIDPARLQQLRTHSNMNLRSRALAILGTESAATRDRKPVVDAFRQALGLIGQPEKGRSVFVKACATCHRAGSQGTDVGPDLATVSGRSPEDLLMHLLDPNREVQPNFMNYNVATTDGRVFSGIIVSETASALTLKRAEGVTDVVPRSQIESIASTGQSLMPEGLEKGFTPQDFADLIAFLRKLPAVQNSPGTSLTR